MSGEPDARTDLGRILLVGFMGSGKSSVGRALGRALDWRFVDFDDAVSAEEGRSVPEIFRASGEDHFRRAEARVGQRLLGEDRVVLASGGGWAAAPGRLDALPPGTATFWLRISSDEAVRRVGGGAGLRPLLAAPGAEERATRLLEEREPFYRLANWAVDTDGRSVEDVTAEVLGILRREYAVVTRTEAE